MDPARTKVSQIFWEWDARNESTVCCWVMELLKRAVKELILPAMVCPRRGLAPLPPFPALKRTWCLFPAGWAKGYWAIITHKLPVGSTLTTQPQHFPKPWFGAILINKCMYVRTYVHTFTYVRTYLCMYVNVCTYVRMYMWTYVHMYVWMYVRVYVWTCERM